MAAARCSSIRSQEVYDPIHLSTARPTLSYNTIQAQRQRRHLGRSQHLRRRRLSQPRHGNIAGRSTIAASARTFTTTRSGRTPTRPGNNSINGLFVRIRTQAGKPLDFVDVPTRWDDTDIVHVVSENLEIAGTPGGSASPGSDRTATTLTDGRLRIDPGMIVKLGDARIETQISSQFIAEGTADAADHLHLAEGRQVRRRRHVRHQPRRLGHTADARRLGRPGLRRRPPAAASTTPTSSMAAAPCPIEGGFDSFNAIEIHQADVRIANSVLAVQRRRAAARPTATAAAPTPTPRSSSAARSRSSSTTSSATTPGR